MNIDIDPNDGAGECIYQITADGFSLVVFVNKATLPETLKTASSLQPGDEVIFGTISCGERVWIVRDESAYWISIGDTDSRDVAYRISKSELDQLLRARAAEHFR